MEKRLYKSNKNKVLCGVCGGIAEYFNVDPTLVRLGWIVFCALGGSGLLAYIIAAVIIPNDPECLQEKYGKFLEHAAVRRVLSFSNPDHGRVSVTVKSPGA